jgi:hypothetical protein
MVHLLDPEHDAASADTVRLGRLLEARAGEGGQPAHVAAVAVGLGHGDHGADVAVETALGRGLHDGAQEGEAREVGL